MIRLIPVVVAVAAGLLIGGCGGQETERTRVARYLLYVGRIETALAKPLADIGRASQDFGRRQPPGLPAPITTATPTPARLVNRALPQISTLRQRVAAVKAPAAAARLRRLVLALIDGQARLASELSTLIVFLPRFEVALRPLGPAMSRLTSTLSQRSAYGAAAVAAVYSAKVMALRRFKTVLDRIAAQLRRLHPPRISRPAWSGQLAAVAGMSANAAKLAGALETGPGPDVSRDLLAFNRAAVSNQTVAAQRAQIASVRAYDRAVGRLTDLARQIDTERIRLSNKLS